MPIDEKQLSELNARAAHNRLLNEKLDRLQEQIIDTLNLALDGHGEEVSKDMIQACTTGVALLRHNKRTVEPETPIVGDPADDLLDDLDDLPSRRR